MITLDKHIYGFWWNDLKIPAPCTHIHISTRKCSVYIELGTLSTTIMHYKKYVFSTALLLEK